MKPTELGNRIPKNAVADHLRKPVIIGISLLAGTLIGSLLRWGRVPKLLGFSSAGFAFLALAVGVFDKLRRLSATAPGGQEPLGLGKDHIDEKRL